MQLPPARRVIGRILSLGFPLPGVRVDNYSFASAPAFFDYDALVVDPSSLARLIEGIADGSLEPKTFADRPVRLSTRGPHESSLADVLRIRRDETTRLLDNGGVVVVFAYPPEDHLVDGDALDDYYWLDAAPKCIAGSGTQLHVVDFQHPLAPFVVAQSTNIAYRAHIDERSLPHGAAVFARSYGGAALAVEMPRENGRVVVIPALRAVPAGDARYAMSESLQAGIRRMLGVMAEGREPYWVPKTTLAGLDEHGAALANARARLEAAERDLRDAEGKYEELARFRRLLWQQGAVGLEDVVLDALRMIGFQVYGNDPSALELRLEGTSVLLEIDAADGPVGMAAHYRLRQRIERAIERRGAAPHGLLLINGHRLLPPHERPTQASDALRTAAETMRYGIGTTAGLFDAIAAYVAGDEASVNAYRETLLSGIGLLAEFSHAPR